MRLAASHPEWVLGFEDETWWSRFARPSLFAWAPDDRPLRLIEQSLAKGDPDPKALAAYGILLRFLQPGASVQEEVWLRFVDGRPLSAVTTQFLQWVCGRLEARGKTALLMPWDNASWHVSKEVRNWIRAHNREVKCQGNGVRIIACYLPTRSPWLNPIEVHWMHAKRKTVEPDRLLNAQELADRVCAHFACHHDHHLTIPEKVA
jgi:hypothetical protein